MEKYCRFYKSHSINKEWETKKYCLYFIIGIGIFLSLAISYSQSVVVDINNDLNQTGTQTSLSNDSAIIPVLNNLTSESVSGMNEFVENPNTNNLSLSIETNKAINPEFVSNYNTPMAAMSTDSDIVSQLILWLGVLTGLGITILSVTWYLRYRKRVAFEKTLPAVNISTQVVNKKEPFAKYEKAKSIINSKEVIAEPSYQPVDSSGNGNGNGKKKHQDHDTKENHIQSVQYQKQDRILIIDDDEIIRNSLSEILKKDGYIVRTSPDADNAFYLLDQEPFSMVLTDLQLGNGADGLDITKRVKHSYPKTMVMLLTGRATIDAAVKALRYGAYDFFQKPYNPDDLRSSIRNHLDRRRKGLIQDNGNNGNNGNVSTLLKDRSHIIFEQSFDEENVGEIPTGWVGEYPYSSLLVTVHTNGRLNEKCMELRRTGGVEPIHYQSNFPIITVMSGKISIEFDLCCESKNKFPIEFNIESFGQPDTGIRTVIQSTEDNSVVYLDIQGEPIPYQLGEWKKIRYQVDLANQKVNGYADGMLVVKDAPLLGNVDKLNTLSIRDNPGTVATLFMDSIRIY